MTSPARSLRHPAFHRWRCDFVGMAEAVARRLEADGVPCPAAAAATRAVRGATGLDEAEFAAEVGITPAQLAVIEAGGTPVRALPDPLLELGSFVDWAAVERRDRRGKLTA